MKFRLLRSMVISFAFFWFAAQFVNNAEAQNVELVPGETYYQTIMSLLDSVKGPQDSIDVLQFNFFTETGQIREIAEKIKVLKNKFPGLQIRIVLEGEKDAEKENGAATRNKKTKAFFADTGIDFFFISGLREGRIKGVTHAKAIRVGNRVLSGSTNLTNTSVGKNNEFNLLVQSDIIANGFKEFVDTLVTNSTQLHPLQFRDGNVEMLTDTAYLDKAMELVQKAKAGESLDIATYFFAYRDEKDVKEKQIFEAIVAAKNRGVAIRVFLERNSNLEVNQDITHANLIVAQKFLDAGITKVYFDPEDKISHSKIIKYVGASERMMLLGSTNLYRGDIQENHQVNFLVVDAVLVDKMTAYLNQKFAYEATPYEHIKSGTKSPRMIRFWRGFVQEGVNPQSFQDILNNVFIAETTAVGSRRGLDAYLPALLPIEKPKFIPEEIALIVYSNDDTYNAIRTTPRGAKYGPMHFEPGLFTRETPQGYKSGSTVAIPYAGDIKNGSAYFLGNSEVEWQTGSTILRVLLPNPKNPTDYKQYFETMAARKGELGIRGGVILFDKDYVLELLNFENKSAAARAQTVLKTIEPERLQVFSTVSFKVESNDRAKLEYGSGTSVEFRTDLLPLNELIEPLLERKSQNPSPKNVDKPDRSSNGNCGTSLSKL